MNFTTTSYLGTLQKPYSSSISRNNNLNQIVINSFVNIQKKTGIHLYYLELDDGFSDMTAKVIIEKKDKLDFI